VVLGELRKDRGLLPTAKASLDVFIVAITGEDVPHALRLAHTLRDRGYRVEYTLSGQAVGKQMKLADARHARVAIVIGPDDRARGEVMIKDLEAKAQQSIATETIHSAVAKILNNSSVGNG
jgi:histidyl-tRNA synthetase